MFSTSEEKLLKLIKKKPISIQELAEKYYEGNIPFEGRNRVASMLNRIQAKLEAFDGPHQWTLVSEGLGRAGKRVWKEYN